MNLSIGVSAALLLAAGCNRRDFVASAGTGDPALAGVVVVCSDFESTAIAVLDGTGGFETAPALLHSGSTTPGVGTALSGDVELPTASPPDGTVLLLDRFPAGVLTWVDPVTAEVLRQVDVGAHSNPQDALLLDDGRWLVTRYGADDLVTFGDDGEVEVALAVTEVDGFPGRPDRLLRVGGEIWVSLGRASPDFQTWRDGKLRRLGPDLVPAGDVDLPGATDCGEMAGGEGGVAVSCSGSFSTGELAPLPETSALVVVGAGGAVVARLDATEPRVGRSFGDGVVFGPGGAVHAVLFGDPEGTPDHVLRWDPATDDVSLVFTATGPFRVSSLAVALDGAVLVPDAHPALPGLCRLEGDGSVCKAVCGATGLPPRGVRALARP